MTLLSGSLGFTLGCHEQQPPAGPWPVLYPDVSWASDGTYWVSSDAGKLALAGPLYARRSKTGELVPVSQRCAALGPGLEPNFGTKPSGSENLRDLGLTRAWPRTAVTESICERAYGPGWKLPTVAQLRYVVSVKGPELESYAFDIRHRLVKFTHKVNPGESSLDEEAKESPLYCIEFAEHKPTAPATANEKLACYKLMEATEPVQAGSGPSVP